MPNELPFRIAVAVILTLTMTVAIYHRVQAARSGERISHQEEGLVFTAVLRLIGLVLWVSVFLYLFAPSAIAWASLPLPDWVRWLGAVIGAFTFPLLTWTLVNLGKNLTDTVVTRQNATLVTSGPYRWVRHPFYVSVGMMVAGVALVSANGFIAICGLATMSLLAIRTAKEEQKLVEKFGDAYRTYMANTGRFLPKFSSQK